MGMYDSLYVKCPNCKKQLEFQSKTGSCMCWSYNKQNLPIEVAIGLVNDVVECQFCGNNFEFKLLSPRIARFKLIKTKKSENYPGNYNPKLKKNIKRAIELSRLLNE